MGQNNVITYSCFGGKSDKLIVMLPPGVGRASHFDRLAKQLANDGFYVLSFNFPGVDGSFFSGKLDVSEISKAIIKQLEIVSYNKLTLIGESYGGDVAIEISKHIKVRRLLLIGCGEYFNLAKKLLLTVLFLPAKIIRPLQPTYASLLTKSKILDFSNFDKNQLDNIYKRWEEIIWYKLPLIKIELNEVYLFIGKVDKIVNSISISKIQSIYPNVIIIPLNCGHFNFQEELAKNNFGDILKLVVKN